MAGWNEGTQKGRRTKDTRWTDVVRDAARELWGERWFVLGGAVGFTALYWVMRLLEGIGG